MAHSGNSEDYSKCCHNYSRCFIHFLSSYLLLDKLRPNGWELSRQAGLAPEPGNETGLQTTTTSQKAAISLVGSSDLLGGLLREQAHPFLAIPRLLCLTHNSF